MKLSSILNIIGIIITLVGIVVSILAMQQPQPEPVCTVGNIVAREGAAVNMNCTVAPQ